MMREERRGRIRFFEDNARTRSGGIDVGKFPVHHFIFDHSEPPLENWPIRIDFTGDDEWLPGCYRFRQRSNTFAVEFVKRGNFHFQQNRRSYRVEPGGVFLVRHGEDSEMECCDCDYALKRTLALTGPMVGPLLTSLGLDRVDVLTPAAPEKLDALFDRAAGLLAGDAADKQQESAALAFRLLLMLAEESNQADTPEILQRILRYLEARLDQPVSIGELAEEFRLSQATLRRLFRKHLGESPVDFLIRRRMETAMRLLRLTEQPVKWIAFQVGYAGALYFSAEFRKFTGESPSAFRKRSQFGE